VSEDVFILGDSACGSDYSLTFLFLTERYLRHSKPAFTRL